MNGWRTLTVVKCGNRAELEPFVRHLDSQEASFLPALSPFCPLGR